MLVLPVFLFLVACDPWPPTPPLGDAAPTEPDASAPGPSDASVPPPQPDASPSDASPPPWPPDASVGECTTSSCDPGDLPCCPGTACIDITRTDQPDPECCVAAEFRLTRGVCVRVCQRLGQPEPPFPLCVP